MEMEIARSYPRVTCRYGCLFSGYATALLAALMAAGCSKSCLSQNRATIHDKSGLTFTVTSTNCDMFGNDTVNSISASDASGGHRKVILKYEPDDRSAPPQITITENNTLAVAIDSVSSVLSQESNYQGHPIRYDIHQVVYPQRGSIK